MALYKLFTYGVGWFMAVTGSISAHHPILNTADECQHEGKLALHSIPHVLRRRSLRLCAGAR